MHIRVNENSEIANAIRKQIHNNNGYCPCKTYKDESTKCICKDFIEQPKGWCDCGLYYKEDNLE